MSDEQLAADRRRRLRRRLQLALVLVVAAVAAARLLPIGVAMFSGAQHQADKLSSAVRPR